MDYKISTKYNSDIVKQTVSLEVEDRVLSVYNFVMEIREKQIKEALMKLGWLPPEKTEARDRYIKLLEDELNDLAGYLHIHGVKFKRLEEFENARREIRGND